MCHLHCPDEGYGNLTVGQLMAEPIVRDLMRADHVDPTAFEALLRSVAAREPDAAAESDPARRGVVWLRSATSWFASTGILPRRREPGSSG